MSSFFNNDASHAGKPLHPNTTLPGHPFTAPVHQRCPARGGPAGEYACRHPEGHAGYHVALGSAYYAWTDNRTDSAQVATRVRTAATTLAQIRRRAEWPECPNCRQSATSQYVKSIGCYRCGWVEGQ